MENKYIIKLALIDKEIRALKTAQKIPSLIRGDSFSFQVVIDGQGDTYNNSMYHYHIVYDDGVQPILSEFYFEGLTWAQEPSSNTQEVFFWGKVSAQCTIMSTRKIISVQKII